MSGDEASQPNPIDRQFDRLAELRRRIEAGEPIDWAVYARLQALDTVEASMYFTKQAIRRTEEADEATAQRQQQADEGML